MIDNRCFGQKLHSIAVAEESCKAGVRFLIPENPSLQVALSGHSAGKIETNIEQVAMIALEDIEKAGQNGF